MCIVNILDLSLLIAFFTAFDRPVIFIDIVLNKFRNLHCFDHLSDRSVRSDQYRMTVFLSKIKCFCHHICIFLNGCRRKNQCVVIAVAAASGKLPVVSLTLCDIAKTGSDSHYINDNCRKVCC